MRFWITSWFTAIMLLVGAASTWGAPHTNTIPFTEASGCCGLPILLVHATVNGKPATLVFDTGAQGTNVSPGIAKGARVVARDVGNAGAISVTTSPVVSVDIVVGTDDFPRTLAFVNSTNQLSDGLGARIDGLLGEDVISQYKRVTIDFEAKTITLEN